MKRKFLVLYDYGQGGLWAYVRANDPEEITRRFRDVEVLAAQPPWWTAENEASTSTFDVDAPGGWLLRIIQSEPSKS